MDMKLLFHVERHAAGLGGPKEEEEEERFTLIVKHNPETCLFSLRRHSP